MICVAGKLINLKALKVYAEDLFDVFSGFLKKYQRRDYSLVCSRSVVIPFFFLILFIQRIVIPSFSCSLFLLYFVISFIMITKEYG